MFLNKVKKTYSIKKAGFAGTLDPLAEGVLIVGTGTATKKLEDLTNCNKSYEFTVRFGVQTSTGDLDGEIINKSDNIPTIKEIEAILPQYTGKIQQTPHVFSALKHQGKRLCDLKRSGFEGIEEISKSKTREIEIFELKLINQISTKEFTLTAKCSKGTYIRSLAEDIAISLSTVATTTRLIRTSVGNFNILDSLKLDLK